MISFHRRNLLIYNTNTKLIIHTNNVKGVNRPLDAIYSLKNFKIFYAVSQSNKIYIYEILNKSEYKKILTKVLFVVILILIMEEFIHNSNFLCIVQIKTIFNQLLF